ncbi:hypothetical protein AYO44_13790 [Planctomycetaceae bacterium SCGC AG-212-F19]|nr:hypothetical protein AYO44_13790 [Planctomycetaceae bacterium SCGC AG-212-F19]
MLAWVDQFHERTGRWPKKDNGRVGRLIDDTWLGLDMALRKGGRGLARSSPAWLIRERIYCGFAANISEGSTRQSQ